VGRSSIKTHPGTGSDPPVRTWENADATHSQIVTESYSTFRVTRVTVPTGSTSLASLLPSGTALADRKKFLIRAHPNNAGTVHYCQTGTAAVVATHPSLVANEWKELWLDAVADVNVIASAASQDAWVEEYA